MPSREGPPKVVLEFPNVRSKAPAEMAVGRGPVDSVHVTTSGTTPVTRVVVDLLRPASLPGDARPRTAPREFTVIFENDDAPAPQGLVTMARGPSVSAAAARRSDRRRWRRCLPRGRARGAAAAGRRAARQPAGTGARGGRGAEHRHDAAVVLGPSGQPRLPGRRPARRAAHLRRDQRPQHRHRPDRAGHRSTSRCATCRGIRRSTSSCAPTSSATPSTARSSASRRSTCSPTKKASAASWPTSRRSRASCRC